MLTDGNEASASKEWHIIYKTSLEIRAKVIFGLPSLKCKGMGICRVIIPPGPLDERYPAKDSSFVSISIDNYKRLRFKFLKDSVNHHFKAYVLHSERFLLREPLALPPSIVEDFDLDYHFIPKGNYGVEEFDSCFSIQF